MYVVQRTSWVLSVRGKKGEIIHLYFVNFVAILINEKFSEFSLLLHQNLYNFIQILLANILILTFDIKTWLCNDIQYDPIIVSQTKWQKLWQLEYQVERILQILGFVEFGGGLLCQSKRSKGVWYIREK